MRRFFFKCTTSKAHFALLSLLRFLFPVFGFSWGVPFSLHKKDAKRSEKDAKQNSKLERGSETK
jgi:hypothetical protein